MSALDNMLADMLKKAIPPEVAELLSPEKLNEFGEKINSYIVDTRERLERIEVQLEKLSYDRCIDQRSNFRKRAVGPNEDGTGNITGIT